MASLPFADAPSGTSLIQSPWRRRSIILGMLLLTGLYLLATLPFLADYPAVNAAEMGIAAPAYKLANEGIYGNDLYRGLHHSESYNYEYMPLFALSVALFFRLLGLGIWQARLVSLFCGLLTIWLTFALGRRLYHPRLGLLAAGSLVLLALTVPVPGAGELYPGALPLLDIARVLRYDIMVPIWLLIACLLFWRAYRQQRTKLFGVAGFFVGLATLSHIYGAMILALFALFLAWQWGRQLLRRPAGYWLIGGWLVALIPWLLYVLQDPAAFQGQLLRHEARFDLLSPGFYLDSLLREPWRYVRFLGGFRRPVLFPRPGLWVAILALIAANIFLWRRIRERQNEADRFLFLSLPLFALLLALLISFKRYTYVALLLPFLVLQIGLGVEVLWATARKSRPLWPFLLALLLLAAGLEGLWHTFRNLSTAAMTPQYLEVTSPVRETVPSGARVLANHNYWLGIAEADVLALDLAFSLSDPAFGVAAEHRLPETLAEIAPEYVVVPDRLLYAYRNAPDELPGPQAIRQWRQLDSFLQNHCTLAATGQDSPDYGQLLLFSCEDTN